MFYKVDGEVVGVLCNWDLAEAKENLEEDNLLALDYQSLTPVLDHLPRNQDSPLSDATIQEIKEGIQRQKPRVINGTRPFISTDLLDAIVPPHGYRHDLESFYWALIWFIVNHDASKSTMRESTLWAKPDIRSVFKEKVAFLLKKKHYHATLSSPLKKNKEYATLIHFYLYGLRYLTRCTHMCDANLKFLRLKRQEAILQGNAELDVKYKEEMAALVEKAAGKGLTYEHFMKALRVASI